MDELETGRPVRRLPLFLGADWFLGGGITVLAALLRFIRLDIPRSLIPLDEFYYPVNSLGLMRHGADYQLVKDAVLPAKNCFKVAIEPAFAVHPPVGKWLIAAGMRIFGCNSFGWRVSSALFGTLTVAIVFLIGRRLFRAKWAAVLAAFLVAVDGLHFVQSRIAMLDIFVTFFIALAIWLLLEDRARTSPFHRGIRWWRIGSGFAIGLGVATKWSAGAVIPFLALFALIWELERRRTARSMVRPKPESGPEPEPLPLPVSGGAGEGEEPPPEDTHPPAPPWDDVPGEPAPVLPALDGPPAGGRMPSAVWATLVRIGAVFVLIPMLVYLVSYVPWFAAGKERYTAPRCQGEIKFNSVISPVDNKIWNSKIWPRAWREWMCYQREIYDFHYHLKVLDDKGKPTHPYLSRAWSWPWMGRPTSHYFDTHGNDQPCGQPRKVAVLKPQITANPSATPLIPSISPTPAPPADPTRPCKTEAEILGLPNPAMWFPAFWLALPLAVWWAIRRRDQVSALLLMLFVPLFLPWLITTRPLFLFYMTPAVPILALLVANMAERSVDEFNPWQKALLYAVAFTIPFTPLYMQWLHTGTTVQLLYKVPTLSVLFLVAAGLSSLIVYGKRPDRIVMAYAALVLAMFAYFYPVLAAVYIPDDGPFGWRKHMWLQQDCGQERVLLACWI